MAPAPNEAPPKNDSAALGILAGLVLGIVAAFATFYVMFVFTYEKQLSHFYSALLIVVLNLLPPSVAVSCGFAARSNQRPRFAAGFYIAAALLVLLEASCAAYLRRS